MTIRNAGYVVTNNEAIWGIGETADAAWRDLRDNLALAGVTLLGEGDDSIGMDGNWTRENGYTVRSASAGLIEAVKAHRGDMAWSMANGVACTRDEFEAEE